MMEHPIRRLLEANNKFRGSPTLPEESPMKSTESGDTFHYQEQDDLPGATLTDADRKMDEVYGDHHIFIKIPGHT
jgi:hypothetical protein